jgi:uncharacterized protein YidB (DUF937 family)
MLEQIVSGLRQQFGTDAGGQSALMSAVLSWLDRRGTGLAGLVSQFQQKGLGPVVSSWVGTGDNLHITPGDLTHGLGQENINEIASKAGIPPETASQQLAQVFPSLIDKLTPQGQVPEQRLVSQGLQILMGRREARDRRRSFASILV